MSARPLRVLAAVVCLAMIGLGVLRGMTRGDQDDKTLLYATSALRPGNAEAIYKLRGALPVIVASCPTAQCRTRTTTRVSSLANYLALSATIRLARLAVDERQAPFCERVSLAYYWGTVLLHGSVYLLVVLLLATDRSAGSRFSTLVLLMLLAAALQTLFPLSPRVARAVLGVLPGARPEYTASAYAPRAALALVFLLQLGAFAAARHRVWVGLTILATFVHAAQALVTATVFALALVLQMLLEPAERRGAAGRLLFLLALEGAVVALAWSIAGGAGTAPRLPLPDLAVIATLVRTRDLAWTLVAGGLALLVWRRGPTLRWRRELLLLAAYLLVLSATDLVSAALLASHAGMPAQLFDRFVGGSSFVIGMLPWLGAALLAHRIAVARFGLAPRLVTVVACLVLATSCGSLLVDREAVVRAVATSRRNLALASSDLCRVTRCSRRGCSFRGFRTMRPEREPTFHVQLFDLLDNWEPYIEAMRRGAPASP